jgi:hypothetical protein
MSVWVGDSFLDKIGKTCQAAGFSIRIMFYLGPRQHNFLHLSSFFASEEEDLPKALAKSIRNDGFMHLSEKSSRRAVFLEASRTSVREDRMEKCTTWRRTPPVFMR